MAMLASRSLVRQVGSLFDGHSVAGLSDRQLLDRFTSQRGALAEAAFAALVVRHGPMVLGVCRQLLGDRHHAEDAFQAVFLVLAQKARSIRDPDLLGNWIYGVAVRTSRCARNRLARSWKNEEAGSMLHVNSSTLVPSAEHSVLLASRPSCSMTRLSGCRARSVCPCPLLPRRAHRPRGSPAAPLLARHGP